MGIVYRKAKIEDVEDIHKLIMSHSTKGVMLARSRQSLYENVREYVVAEDDGEIVAVGGLRILWNDLAEVRSLVVTDSYSRQGVGSRIVAELEEEARELGLPKLFALTYQAGFFRKNGYEEVPHKSLPQKVWRDCIDCPKFPECEEVAVVKPL